MNPTVKICAIVIVIAFASCQKDQQSTILIPCMSNGLEDHLLAFYPFSNGTLNDISGNNRHLTNPTNAHPAMDRNGTVNCAFAFTNRPDSGEFLTTANVQFLDNLQAFSISLWYQPKDSTRGSVDFECLVNRDEGGRCPDRYGQWSVALYDCRKAVFGRTNSVWDQHIVANSQCREEIHVRTGDWHHLAATFSQNDLKMKIYRDGVLQDSASGPANCTEGMAKYEDIGDLFVGKYYTGKIDDIAIFSKALTEKEVNTLLETGPCCSE